MPKFILVLLIILIIAGSLFIVLRHPKIGYWHEYTKTIDSSGRKQETHSFGWGEPKENNTEDMKRLRLQMQEQAQYFEQQREKQRQYFEQQGKEMQENFRRFEEEMKSKGF